MDNLEIQERNRRLAYREMRRRQMRINGRKNKPGRARVLSDQDIHLIRHELRGSKKCKLRQQLSFEMMLYLGLRVGELCYIRVVDLVDDRGCIRNCVEVRTEKRCDKRYRRIPIHEDLARKLPGLLGGDLCRNTGRLILPAVRVGNGFDGIELPRSRKNMCMMVYYYLKRIRDKYGLVGLSSHSMRRTWITRLYSKGVKLITIQELAGHKWINSLMPYIEESWEQKIDAVKCLDF